MQRATVAELINAPSYNGSSMSGQYGAAVKTNTNKNLDLTP